LEILHNGGGLIVGFWEDANLKLSNNWERLELTKKVAGIHEDYTRDTQIVCQILWWNSTHGEIWFPVKNKLTHRLFYYTRNHIGIKTKPESKNWQNSSKKTSKLAQEFFEQISTAVKRGFRPNQTQAETDRWNQLVFDICQPDKLKQEEAQAKRIAADKQIKDEIYSSISNFCELWKNQGHWMSLSEISDEIYDNKFKLLPFAPPNFYITYFKDTSEFKVEFGEKKFWNKSLEVVLEWITQELNTGLVKIA